MANNGGSGGNSKDVRAGGAFVEIFGKDNLSRLLGQFKTRVEGFAGVLRKIGGGAGIIGTAMFAPLTAFLVQGVNKAADIDRMAESLGFTRTEMQRLAYASEVAGVSIDEVIDNQAKFQDLMRDAPVMDDQTIRDSASASREFAKSMIEIRNAMTPLVSVSLPFIQMIGEFVKRNAGLVRILFAVGVGLTIGGGLLIGFGASLTALTTIIGTLLTVGSGIVGTVFTPMGIAIGVAVAGGLALTAAFIGMNVWLLTLTENGREFLGSFTKMFEELSEIAGLTLGGIWAALTKNDWNQAWAVMKSGGIAAFKSIEAWSTYVWVSMKNGLVDSFRKGWNEVKNLTLDFMAWTLRNAPDFLTGGMSDELINNRRDQLKAENNQQLQAELDAAKKFRDEQIKAANAEVIRAMGRLDVEVAKAKQGAMAGFEGFDHPPPPMIHAVRGAFRVLGDGRQFGTGNNMAKQQLEAQKKAVGFLEEIRDYTKAIQKAFAFA